MDIQRHDELCDTLEKHYTNQQATITFTQWDTDNEDEEETVFAGTLVEVQLSDNEFGEKDLLLHFAADDQEVVEILMEIPKTEADLASFDGSRLAVFGTEAELSLVK